MTARELRATGAYLPAHFPDHAEVDPAHFALTGAMPSVCMYCNQTYKTTPVPAWQDGHESHGVCAAPACTARHRADLGLSAA